MAKRVFIVHGWEGTPQEGWFPWLKRELEAKGINVFVPAMPDTDHPVIDAWVNFLKEQVGIADEETYFVGHSIGCQTILRYLQGLDLSVRVGGVLLVAPWMHLTEFSLAEEGVPEIAKPWLETPMEWIKITSHSDDFVAIFSDNDQHVPFSDKEIFQEKLQAKILVEHGKGHMGGEDKIMELPVVLKEVLAML